MIDRIKNGNGRREDEDFFLSIDLKNESINSVVLLFTVPFLFPTKSDVTYAGDKMAMCNEWR